MVRCHSRMLGDMDPDHSMRMSDPEDAGASGQSDLAGATFECECSLKFHD